MTNGINRLACLAAGDETKLEELIQSQESTILRTASCASHRYVSKSDDEWSVALCAFSRAVDVYSEEKGNFLPFAQMLIKRALIDHFRSKKSTLYEVPVAPHVLAGECEPEEDPEGVYLAVVKSSREAEEHALKDEIQAVSDRLLYYGIRFLDLTECSPQQGKTRRECAIAIRTVLANDALFSAMRKSRRLPMKELAALSGVPRKTLDRYRKYIIMAALILDGDYPHLAEYLKFVKEV